MTERSEGTEGVSPNLEFPGHRLLRHVIATTVTFRRIYRYSSGDKEAA